MARVRDAKREDYWRKALRRRVRSGLTVAEFCRKEGVTPTTYHYWQRVIKGRDLEQKSKSRRSARASTRPSSDTGSFAPVRLLHDQEPSSVEVVARNGLVVRIGEQATTEQVRRVLQVVSELG